MGVSKVPWVASRKKNTYGCVYRLGRGSAMFPDNTWYLYVYNRKSSRHNLLTVLPHVFIFKSNFHAYVTSILLFFYIFYSIYDVTYIVLIFCIQYKMLCIYQWKFANKHLMYFNVIFGRCCSFKSIKWENLDFHFSFSYLLFSSYALMYIFYISLYFLLSYY